MYPTYLILTKAIWEGKLPAKLKTADRLSWNEYTYKDVEKTAKRMVDKYDYHPSEDNTKYYERQYPYDQRQQGRTQRHSYPALDLREP